MPTIDDFRKFEFKIAKIVEVEDHPNADKLYVIKIDAGGTEKQIVAGIKLAYTKEELIGKSVVLADNLDPATLRGVESQGMLLAATGQDGVPILVVPEKQVEPGAKVK
ncbi:MAG: hypothetical protein AABZ57_07275 [Candidatus Margulisiibacteriota bacterium]